MSLTRREKGYILERSIAIMEALQKLKILGASARYDICSTSLCGRRTKAQEIPASGITRIYLPDGRCISQFRALLTNACENDCFYCVNSSRRNFPRTSFQPEELAKLFMDFHRRNYVAGLFLSSGIYGSASRTMEQMIKTVEILRFRHGYSGYVHLKILPGADRASIEQASRLANRLSINLEAPNPLRLKAISHCKDLPHQIIQRMRWIDSLAREGLIPSGQTTQFVVGAAGESDLEILRAVSWLYGSMNLRRAYFSAFSPIPGTPLENHPPTPSQREHRLYQADFLLRQYGFKLSDLVFDEEDNFPQKMDPKVASALKNIELFPVEINRASFEQLLRVPGIGRVSASRIVKLRRERRFTELGELRQVGVVTAWARPFVLLNGRRQGELNVLVKANERQLSLWEWGEERGQMPWGIKKTTTVNMSP